METQRRRRSIALSLFILSARWCG